MRGRLRLAALLATALTACGGPPPAPENAPAAAAPTPAPGAAAPAPAPAPAETDTVTLYFPSENGDDLVGESRVIPHAAYPGEKARRIVALLVEGPETEGLVEALPKSAEVRQVYVLEDGTAWVDFAPGLAGALEGGSATELAAVYGVVDSIARNVPEIHRVGILVGGRPVDTLGGHVDLRRALPPHAADKKE